MYRILLLFAMLLSCTEEKVELPVIAQEGITGVYNTSNIWFFFKIHQGDTLASVNSKNKIANTHLIFHIDKKLQMKHIVPELVAIQNKLQEKTMHKKEGMKNYMSYADPENKTYALVDFTNTRFSLEDRVSRPDTIKYDLLNLCQKEFVLRDSTYPIVVLELKLKELLADTAHARPLALRFCGTLAYDQYLYAKSLLQKHKIDTDNTEIIYSKK